MKYQQLSADERVVIATLHKQGMNAPQIRDETGRHRSTVWRELRHNRAPYDRGRRSARAVAETNRATIELIKRHRGAFRTITSDNGTEFHGYEEIERATGVRFYFTTPRHSWERATNENTNGLLRQYLPERTSLNASRKTGAT